MRVLWIYLAIYVTLVAAALIALWRGGVLAYLSPLSVALTFVIALALGALLAIVWRWRPPA